MYWLHSLTKKRQLVLLNCIVPKGVIMRAKFTVQSVKEFGYGGKEAELNAVYSGKPEDNELGVAALCIMTTEICVVDERT
jgi:hypothetical protein